jgi:hypothetical protein
MKKETITPSLEIFAIVAESHQNSNRDLS